MLILTPPHLLGNRHSSNCWQPVSSNRSKPCFSLAPSRLWSSERLSSNLVEATAASSDYEVLLQVLSSLEAIALLRQNDPLATAKLRGLQLKQQLIEAEGGCLSSTQAGQILGISYQAVDKRRRQSQSIGIAQGKGSYLYPGWQFTESGSTLDELEAVLTQLQSFDPWMQLAFMLNPRSASGATNSLRSIASGRDRVSN